MGALILAIQLNPIGKLIYEVLYLKWVKGFAAEDSLIGAFAITVILFTLFLKVATLPLDLWQKQMGRKNARKMQIMKPELDKVQKLFGADKQQLMLKQREVHKKYKYSAFSACLPAIVTMVIFIIVLNGFNSAVRYQNEQQYLTLKEVYDTTYIAEKEKGSNDAVAGKAAEDAVVASYKPESFLLTVNIFRPDSWKKPIPTAGEYSGSGMGNMNIGAVDRRAYDVVMKPLMDKYNDARGGWNGFLILPILSFLLSVLSAKLVKPPEQPAMAGQTAEQQKQQQSQAKMMQYMMPIMFAVFTLFYSTAFALYMVVSSLFSTVFNVAFNLITKQIDKKNNIAA
ncbi:MAG: membrane protein insertase YidC [Christensenellaceae bacterium]|jgi:YidC/Oxa1 family membrane protein insertase|nr:membrane protein insertase YidC [Christensenellaceae bacterium]